MMILSLWTPVHNVESMHMLLKAPGRSKGTNINYGGTAQGVPAFNFRV